MSVKAMGLGIKKRHQNFGHTKTQQVWDKTNGICYYCKSQLPENEKIYSPHGSLVMEIRHWHIDHLLPVIKGGTDGINNLVPACIACNLKKHDKTAEEFIAQMEQ